MARFVALLFLAAVICSTYAFPKQETSEQCGPNEVYDVCGKGCEPSCQNPEPRFCFVMCRAGCQCKDGLVRSKEGGECIPQPQCALLE